MKNCCAVIAEPPLCFDWGYDEEDQHCGALKLLLLNQLSYLQTQGISHFYIPLDAGFGLYASEIVNSLRATNEELKLTCLIPYEDQGVKWPPDLRDRYYDVLEKCTDTILISFDQTSTSEVDAYMTAIDHSEKMIAVLSGERPRDQAFAVALRYAEKIRKEQIVLTTPRM